ncbi:type III secretion protein [Yersinia aldovae]|uniref:SpaN/EivJ family type III secretion system needle length determinant n=1 Tax=Yersinia aldovae TaxID=29483 RepID=UPI0005E88425|nr:type III secretion protein [Yersinia aldovae]CNK23221.1 type III secretion protein [Yersinia aldovae]
MVAIKQVANNALPDIRKDEPAAVSRPETLRGDNGQAVKSVQQEAQKKMAELLAKAKLRKKQAEEQLSASQFTPMMTTKSMPLSKQMALPNIAQQPDAMPVQKQGVWVPGHKGAERPPVLEETRTKPVVDKASGAVATEVLTKLTETLTQSPVVPRDNGEQPQPRLVSASREKPEMSTVSVASVPGVEQKEEMSYTSVSQEMPRFAVEQPMVASSESAPELTSSLPLAEKKESTLNDNRTQVLTTPQWATQAATITQPEEVKTAPSALTAALPESAAPEGETTVGRRTLSYTFTQWKNSPVVTFELSKAGELTAMTNSVEVQQTLESHHHLLESENPLHFRDERHDEERRGQQQSEQEDET